MPEVLILVSSERDESGNVRLSPTANRMVSAIEQAILQNSYTASGENASSDAAFVVKTIAVCSSTDPSLFEQSIDPQPGATRIRSAATAAGSTSWVCPLTLDLPRLNFSQQTIYQDCRDLPALRRKVTQQFQVEVGEGRCWLPIVLTTKGPLYAEVITVSAVDACNYQQPWHLPDRQRQSLYQFSYQLLKNLSAPPATYLLQFGLREEGFCFDRLLPFPAEPAIASIESQHPNLFECHWRCLTHQPILDLQIVRL